MCLLTEAKVCSTSEDTSTTNSSAQKLFLLRSIFFSTVQFPEESHRCLCSPKRTESQ